MNKTELESGLQRIRQFKLLTNLPLLTFVTCVIIFFSLEAFGHGGWFKPIYQVSFVLGVFGFVMLFVQENIKCPNCGKKFNVKLKPLYFVRNLFSKKCMNCWLELNGSNVSDYANGL